MLLHPYIELGAGVARVEVNDFTAGDFNDDDIVFAYQGGAGLAFDLTERLTVDLGYRYFATDDPSFSTAGNNISQDVEFEYAQHGALVSLRYLFAPTGRADSDGDGVPDILDKCPNTPAGAPVDANGCPLDSDGDGVPDDRDRCPDTPSGVAVTADGCAVGQSTILRDVNYEFNKATLTPRAREVLDGVAKTLRDSPGFGIELSGHTDSIGSDSYNQQLSQARAESAREYLISQGIASNRIEARGYGESRPIAANTNPDGSDNPAGRAQNRGTEILILQR